MISRQPAGAPQGSGGEFAKNDHGDAPDDLEGEVSIADEIRNSHNPILITFAGGDVTPERAADFIASGHTRQMTAEWYRDDFSDEENAEAMAALQSLAAEIGEDGDIAASIRRENATRIREIGFGIDRDDLRMHNFSVGNNEISANLGEIEAWGERLLAYARAARERSADMDSLAAGDTALEELRAIDSDDASTRAPEDILSALVGARDTAEARHARALNDETLQPDRAASLARLGRYRRAISRMQERYPHLQIPQA